MNRLVENEAYENAEDGFVTMWLTYENVFSENEACENATSGTGHDAYDENPPHNIWEENSFCTYSGF